MLQFIYHVLLVHKTSCKCSRTRL